MPSRRKVLLLAALLLAAAHPFLASPASGTAQAACPKLEAIPGVGPVCAFRPGLWEVYAPDGSFLGYTHGPDPRPATAEGGIMQAGSPAGGSTAPTCMDGAAGERYVHVIYARAHDDADQYASMATSIRSIVGGANAIVDDAAIATSDRLSIRILCAAGQVVVENEALPTDKVNASFSTIVSDLEARGYNDPFQKYWVYYDDSSVCQCLGIGNIYFDETNAVDNMNNGPVGASPMFGVVFAAAESNAMLHELGHTLGAVQDNAPYSTLAGHCYDGRDTMCYNDGGPRGSLYKTTYCSSVVFDCSKQTYCNAYPVDGSYLAMHWSACSRLSRFLVYPANEPPVVAQLVCSPTPAFALENVTCTMQASDAAPNVSYAIDWGDGSSTRAPASGTVATGATVSATHVYGAQGAATVRVSATDIGYPPMTSAPASFDMTIAPPNDAPAFDPIACTPSAPAEGDAITCTVRATDNENVSYAFSWGDGNISRSPASGFVPGGTAASFTHTYLHGADYAMNATAIDDGRPAQTTVLAQVFHVQDINTAPIMRSLLCPVLHPRPGQSVHCDFVADDDSPGIHYRIDWGDGAIASAPASGDVAPGTKAGAEHAYASDGHFIVNITAIDDSSPSLTSAPMSVTMFSQADQDGPSTHIDFPLAGQVDEGCTVVAPNPSEIDPGLSSSGGTNPIFIRSGCIKLKADDISGVDRVEVYTGARLLASDRNAPYVLLFTVPGFAVNDALSIVAWDKQGNRHVDTLVVDALGGQD